MKRPRGEKIDFKRAMLHRKRKFHKVKKKRAFEKKLIEMENMA